MEANLENFDRIVSVDYFHGRRVEAVTKGDGSEGAPAFTIHLEGGGLITVYDDKTPTPTAIVGAAFTKTIMDNQRTRLYFGLEEVVINPMRYSITDTGYTDGKEVFAQRSNVNDGIDNPRTGLPVDPSKDRVADGPEEDDDDGA